MRLENRWKIDGPVPKAKLSPLYRVATVLAALCMVLLPLIYVGIVVGLGKWLWYYAQHGGTTSGRGAARASLWTYVVPLVVGAIALVFMVKPLFSRRPKSVKPRQLSAADEPQLFAFIEDICDAVGAPRPKRVQVDLQPNASAALSHGIGSLLTRNLTLTIGLPLAGGLSARQFGGVLAHEFGHFAQGSGMITTYAVRSVSFWFARVVYERDRLDELLDDWAKNSDWRIMIVLQIARFFVWLTRRILWLLMVAGQAISCVLMRQMEFDADHYEIQLSGSEAFVATARELRIIGVGSHIAWEQTQESYNTRRIVDNLPGLMLHQMSKLPPDIREKILAAEGGKKAAMFDTHPDDGARIAAAERAAAPGVLETTAAGKELFADFDGLCREVTLVYYRDVLNLPMTSVELVSLSGVTEEDERDQAAQQCMKEVFHEFLSPVSMFEIRPGEIRPDRRAAERNRLLREAPDGSEMGAVEALRSGFDRYCHASAVLALNSAQIPVRLNPEWGLTTVDTLELMNLQRQFKSDAEKWEQAIDPVLQRYRNRTIAALSWLAACDDAPGGLLDELDGYAAVLAWVADSSDSLRQLQESVSRMAAILRSTEYYQPKGRELVTALESADEILSPLLNRITGQTQTVAYPLPHARGKLPLSVFLIADVSHPEPLIRNLLTGDAVITRVHQTCYRIVSRIAVLVAEAEAKMDAETAAGEPGPV